MVWISDELKNLFLRLGAEQDVPLRDLTSFRIGGNAAFVLRPRTYADIGTAIDACERAGFPR